MYAVGEKENPCKVTILETYASHAAYEKHIASEPVSYTHLDVYKRQILYSACTFIIFRFTIIT